MIWVFAAVLTFVVLAILLLPLLRGREAVGADDRNAYDRTVFRDQLAELDRDLARGLIGAKEAEAARNEIARRLIAAAAAPEAKRRSLPLAAAAATVLIVPLVAIPL